MFKFSIFNKVQQKEQNFYNESESLSRTDLYRFLSWLDLSEFNISLSDVHQLLKTGEFGDYKLLVVKCTNTEIF